MIEAEQETVAEIVEEMRDEITGTRFVADGMIASLHKSQEELRTLADRIEAAWKRERVLSKRGENDNSGCDVITGWKYPLTNMGHRGNQRRGPLTPVTIVRDSEGNVLMYFVGAPYRTNEEAIVMASEFCSDMNEWHERVVKTDMMGNAAAMRDALIEAIGRSCAGCARDCDECVNLKSGWMKKAKAALIAPPRNCDVGTADEQLNRFDKFCNQKTKCRDCAICGNRFHTRECFAIWAQTQFEKEGEK